MCARRFEIFNKLQKRKSRQDDQDSFDEFGNVRASWFVLAPFVLNVRAVSFASNPKVLTGHALLED